MRNPMASLFPPPDDELDRVVWNHLETDSSKTKAAEIFGAALVCLSKEPTQVVAKNFIRRDWLTPAMLMALAASLFIAVYFIPPIPMVLAKPAESLRVVRTTHLDDADRSYKLKINGPAALTRRWEKFFGEEPLVHTRGNRFFEELAGSYGFFGRDGDGRIWIALNRDAAISFDSEELPAPLRELVMLRGLELPAIIDDVLGDFDIDWFEGRPDSKRIIAKRRTSPRQFQLIEADIQLNDNSLFVERLILTRYLSSGEQLQFFYELTKGAPREASEYTPRGHIHQAAPVYESDRSLARRRALLGLFGEAFLNGG